MWLGSLFYSLGADAQKHFSPYIPVWIYGTVKIEQDSDHGSLTDIKGLHLRINVLISSAGSTWSMRDFDKLTVLPD